MKKNIIKSCNPAMTGETMVFNQVWDILPSCNLDDKQFLIPGKDFEIMWNVNIPYVKPYPLKRDIKIGVNLSYQGAHNGLFDRKTIITKQPNI